MDVNKVDSPAARPAAAPPPAKGSSARLMVLLGLLAIVLVALAYDQLLAKPGADNANKEIHEFVDERNRQSVREADLVTSADIQKKLGKTPTFVKKNDKEGWTVEYYCWWGPVPVFNMRRHFIAVVYLGKEPRHYSAHYQEEPPQEAYPILDAPDAAGKGGPIETPQATVTSADSPPAKDAAADSGDKATGDKASGDKAAKDSDKSEEKSADKPPEAKSEEKAADKPAAKDDESKSDAKPKDESGGGNKEEAKPPKS